MRIKHYQGYGLVNAKKLSKKEVKVTSDLTATLLRVKVSGNHEWGLIRKDSYDLYNWLVKKFEKEVELNPYYDMKFKITDCGSEDGVEYVIYEFLYAKDLKYNM